MPEVACLSTALRGSRSLVNHFSVEGQPEIRALLFCAWRKSEDATNEECSSSCKSLPSKREGHDVVKNFSVEGKYRVLVPKAKTIDPTGVKSTFVEASGLVKCEGTKVEDFQSAEVYHNVEAFLDARPEITAALQACSSRAEE